MAVLGVTAKLEYESGSGWAEVTNCKSITFPQLQVGAVETTHLGVSDYGRTHMPGLIEANVISFECEYTSEIYTALHGLIRDTLGWRVTSPTGEDDVMTCDGFLTSVNLSLTPDAEVMITGEIKLTGVPVLS